LEDIQFLSKISPWQTEQIAAWLKEDKDPSTGIGLFGNWEFIKKHIANGTSLIAVKKNRPIGFVCYSTFNRYSATIKYIGVQNAQKNKGIARKLTTLLTSLLKGHGILVVDLFCSPPKTRIFWQKLGFLDALKYYSNPCPRMYIPLVKYLSQSDEPSNTVGEFLQLWNVPGDMAKERSPTYTWKLEFMKGLRQLTYPIVIPCLADWQLRHTRDGQVIFDQKVTKHKLSLYQDDFLLIAHL